MASSGVMKGEMRKRENKRSTNGRNIRSSCKLRVRQVFACIIFICDLYTELRNTGPGGRAAGSDNSVGSVELLALSRRPGAPYPVPIIPYSGQDT